MDAFSLARSMRHKPWIGYIVAVFLTVICLAVRIGLGDAFVGFPYITFFPAVLVTALVGTRGAGILATLLSAGFVGYFLIEPIGHIVPADASSWVGLGFFLLVSATIITLVDWLNDALDRADWLSSWSSGSSEGGSDNRGRNRGHGTNSSTTHGYSEQMDHLVEPGAFGRMLKTGGPANRNRVSAIWYQAGRRFVASGGNAMLAEFQQ